MSDKPHDQSQIILQGSDLRDILGPTAKTVTVQSNRQHPIIESQWHWLNLLFPPARPRDMFLQIGARVFPTSLAIGVLVTSSPLWWGTADLIPFLVVGAIAIVAAAWLFKFIAENVPNGKGLMFYHYLCVLIGVLLALNI